MSDLKARLMRPKVVVGRSSIPNAGYGVFATHQIAAGEMVEECPYILIPHDDNRQNDYTFKYNDEFKMMVLGFGSLYNHSDSPNLTYTYDETNRVMCYCAARPIAPGEECFINYGETWFKTRSVAPAKPVEPQRGLFGVPYLGEGLLLLILVLAVVIGFS